MFSSLYLITGAINNLTYLVGETSSIAKRVLCWLLLFVFKGINNVLAQKTFMSDCALISGTLSRKLSTTSVSR